MAATTAAHKHPNYMTIFWWLAILTVIELAVIFLPLAKVTIGVLLVALALGKAALVAMYFMHLRFEIADAGAHRRHSAGHRHAPDLPAPARRVRRRSQERRKKPAASAPAKH